LKCGRKIEGEVLALRVVTSALDLRARVAIVFEPSLVVVHDESLEMVRVVSCQRHVDFVVLIVYLWILAVTLALPQQCYFKSMFVCPIFIIVVELYHDPLFASLTELRLGINLLGDLVRDNLYLEGRAMCAQLNQVCDIMHYTFFVVFLMPPRDLKFFGRIFQVGRGGIESVELSRMVTETQPKRRPAQPQGTVLCAFLCTNLGERKEFSDTGFGRFLHWILEGGTGLRNGR
jgi:hypothetical protein